MRSDKLEYGSLGYGDAPRSISVFIGGLIAIGVLAVCGIDALTYLLTQ